MRVHFGPTPTVHTLQRRLIKQKLVLLQKVKHLLVREQMLRLFGVRLGLRGVRLPQLLLHLEKRVQDILLAQRVRAHVLAAVVWGLESRAGLALVHVLGLAGVALRGQRVRMLRVVV